MLSKRILRNHSVYEAERKENNIAITSVAVASNEIVSNEIVSPEINPKHQRDVYDGVDIFRFICSLCVISVHFQPHHSVFLDNTAILSSGLRTRFFIAVFCFFLAGSTRKVSGHEFYRSTKRLLVPYLFWTTIYFALRVFLYTGDKRTNYLLRWPIAYFVGDSAVQMYFIPMVILASLCLFLLHYFIFQRERWKVTQNPIFLLVSIAISVFARNVSFQTTLESHSQAEYIVKQYGLWMIDALPFLTTAYLLSNLRVKDFLKKHRLIIVTVGWISFLVCEYFLWQEVTEIVATCQSLLLLVTLVAQGQFSWFASWRNLVREGSVIIFFIHPLYIEAYKHLKIYRGRGDAFTGGEALFVVGCVVLSAFLIFRFVRPYEKIYFMLTGRAPQGKKKQMPATVLIEENKETS